MKYDGNSLRENFFNRWFECIADPRCIRETLNLFIFRVHDQAEQVVVRHS